MLTPARPKGAETWRSSAFKPLKISTAANQKSRAVTRLETGLAPSSNPCLQGIAFLTSLGTTRLESLPPSQLFGSDFNFRWSLSHVSSISPTWLGLSNVSVSLPKCSQCARVRVRHPAVG